MHQLWTTYCSQLVLAGQNLPVSSLINIVVCQVSIFSPYDASAAGHKLVNSVRSFHYCAAFCTLFFHSPFPCIFLASFPPPFFPQRVREGWPFRWEKKEGIWLSRQQWAPLQRRGKLNRRNDRKEKRKELDVLRLQPHMPECSVPLLHCCFCWRKYSVYYQRVKLQLSQ